MKKYLCGVDLGGTKLSAGIFNSDGTLVDKRKVFDHKDLDCDGITERVIRLIRELLDKNGIMDEDLQGIGICMAGHVNYKKGLLITSSNFRAGFNNYPIREKVARKFRTHVILDNDANAQAYGELMFGAGRNFSDLIFLTVSTGVGCGIIVDRKLIRGMTGTAGEVGHTIIDPASDVMCSCGNYGCLMSLSSGQYLAGMYRKYLMQGEKSAIGVDLSNVDDFNGLTMRRGLEEEDVISRKVLADSASAVGTGVYNLFQVLNPEIFIIGGGLTNCGDVYFDMIEEKFLSLVKRMMYDKPEIRPSALGNSAGLLGAAALTLESI